MRALSKRNILPLATSLVMACGGKTEPAPTASAPPAATSTDKGKPEAAPAPGPDAAAAPAPEVAPTPRPEAPSALAIAPTPTPTLAAAPSIVQTIELSDPAHHVRTLLSRPDGSLVALGVSVAEGDQAIHLLAFGPDGQPLWYQTHGDHHELAEQPNAGGVALSDGGFIAVGRKMNPGDATEVWLARFGSSGTLQREVAIGAAYARANVSWLVPVETSHLLVSTSRGELAAPTLELVRISLDGAVTHTVTPPGELSLPWREANGELRTDVSAGLGLTRHLIDPGTGSLMPAPDASSKWEDVTTDMITTTLLLADGTRVLVTKPVGQDTTSLTKTNDKGENLWSVTLDGKQLGAAFVATLTSEGLALGSRPETSDGSTAPFRIVRMR